MIVNKGKYLMRLVEKYFRLFFKGQVNILRPIEESNCGALEITHSVPIQTRNSPDIPEPVKIILREVCLGMPTIERCHILDVLDPSTGQVRRFIVLAVDDGNMEAVVPRLREAMKQHSWFDDDCFITSSDTFPDIFEESDYAIYLRADQPK